MRGTPLQCLNQLGGFPASTQVTVTAATHRGDILDRTGSAQAVWTLDGIPHAQRGGAARILRIRPGKMNVSPAVNPEELARCAEDFSAPRGRPCGGRHDHDRTARAPDEFTQDSTEGVLEAPAKKKASLKYHTCSLVWCWLDS